MSETVNLGYHNGKEYVTITVHLPEYEAKFMDAVQDYCCTHYRQPKYLVLSSVPYQALRYIAISRYGAHFGAISYEEIVEWRGFKVIPLFRYDKEIIEVG